MVFTACEGGSPDDETNGNPTEQPGENDGNENGDGNGNQGGGDNPGGGNGEGNQDGEEGVTPTDKTQIINFQDEATKQLCILNWDKNEDGELSYEEAAAVTDLGSAFKGSSITTFNELKHFTGLTGIADSAFDSCANLNEIEIPDSVTSIGEHAFYDCSSLRRVDITDLSAWCKIVFTDFYANPLLIVMLAKLLQSENAYRPISVTLFGIVILVKLLQL